MSCRRPTRGKGKLVHQLAISTMMTATEVALLLKVQVRTVNRMVAAGTIPHSRIGGTVRFHREAIDGWTRQKG